MPGDDYDADNMLDGLFKSYFLVRRNTLHTSACNVSSKSQWNELDGKLSYCELYRSIVSFLRDPPDTEWRDELLKWWNKELFGDENGHGNPNKHSADASSKRMSTMERMRAQTKARLTAGNTSSSMKSPPLAPGISTASDEVTLPQNAVSPTNPIPTASVSTMPSIPANLAVPFVPSTPIPDSPLTEDDGIVLTPITNKKAKNTTTGKGKKMATEPDSDKADSVTQTRKAKRMCK
ncbi:hypothetical protein BS17DRAFT_766515 [Gyrodon lividus]|nr:hypothetical protein BS17DRAFT_766515 [Gyrodon lividus]